MIQKRGHAEQDDGDRVLSSKRSRSSTSPAPVSSGSLEGKPALSSSGGKENHAPGIETNDGGHDNEEEDDDYTSSSGSSSSSSDEDDEDDDDNEEEDGDEEDENPQTIPYIPGRPKPQISLPPTSSNLLSRISSFLPQLQAANADIERRLAKGESLEDLILDDVKDDHNEAEGDGEGQGEGKAYIEMNLGLGVLKEKKKRQPGEISLADESASSDSSDEDEDQASLKDGAKEGGEGQVLNQLMGLKSRLGQKPIKKPGIQEVDEG